jgi:hypothetical protein
VAPDLLDILSRAGQAYAPVSEPPPGAPSVDGVASASVDASFDSCAVEGFARSAERFCALACWLSGEQARGLEHAELEARLEEDGRELLRALFQDHLDLRAAGEPRLELVVGCDGARRSNVERGHERALETVFGEVEVRRLGYRARARENLYPADAQLNLPAEKHPHGMRRLAALEAPRSSFQAAAIDLGLPLTRGIWGLLTFPWVFHRGSGGQSSASLSIASAISGRGE